MEVRRVFTTETTEVTEQTIRPRRTRMIDLCFSLSSVFLGALCGLCGEHSSVFYQSSRAVQLFPNDRSNWKSIGGFSAAASAARSALAGGAGGFTRADLQNAR